MVALIVISIIIAIIAMLLFIPVRIKIYAKYENSKFLNEDKWNLFVDDWEPMFLPVGRCWKSWDGEKFTGDGADKVLKAVGLEFDEKVNLDMLH